MKRIINYNARTGLGLAAAILLLLGVAFFPAVRTLAKSGDWVTLLLCSLISGLLAFACYITSRDRERKRTEETLRESELRFRIVARATNEAVWDWNLGTNAVWWNRSIQTLFGYSDEQVGANHNWWVENLHAEDRERVVSSLNGVVRSNRDFWSGEYRFRREDGVYADILDRGYIVRSLDGEAIRMIGAMQDVTERKREQELARSRDAALESARLKSMFLANMSHEIRTPMNSVIGMTGLLLDTDLSEEQREFAETVRISGESLLTIINDILDFSKIEAGKLTFERVDFNPRSAVEEVIDLLAEQARAKKLELASSAAEEVPSLVRGDPGRLRQVLTNLVGNAVKFTDEGQVNVFIRKEKETAGHVVLRFEVTDTGIGIPEAARSRLFQPFSQVDSSSSRRYGGTGLGLAICKQLVQLMAGQIGVESVPKRGSAFWFTARFEKSPVEETAANATAAEEPMTKEKTASAPLPAEERKLIRLLVAEDNVFNQKVVLRQLQQMGYSVDVVANGVEVLEAMERIPYDLVLMDCQMPEMDGYEATLEVRRRECNSKHTPIIAMTAHVMKEDRDKCLAAGMDDFLSKPVRLNQLKEVLIHWLSKRPLPPTSTEPASKPPTQMISAAPLESAMGWRTGMAVPPLTPVPADKAVSREGNGGGRSWEASPATVQVSENPKPGLDSKDIVDMEIFTEVAGEEPEPRRQLALRYLKQTSEQLTKIEAAIGARAPADIKRIAHSAAGSSAMCGMIALSHCLRELERMGQEERLDKAAPLFDQAAHEFTRIKQFLLAHEEIQGNDYTNCRN